MSLNGWPFTAGYDEPQISLTANECADVIRFIANSEPEDAEKFFAPMANPSPQIGLMYVLGCIENHLRATRRRKAVANG
jgi:hypothetical protein